MLKYYGIDWIAAILLLVNVWLLGSNKRCGWAVGAVACCFSTAFAIMIGSLPQIAMNLMFIILNIRGYYKWKKDEKAS